MMSTDRVARRVWDRRDRGVVEDVIDALHRAPAHFESRGVAADESNVIAHGTQILATPGREVIEDGDLCAIAYETFHEMRADEPGAASNEVSHAGW
jgi:hypothetical protein